MAPEAKEGALRPSITVIHNPANVRNGAITQPEVSLPPLDTRCGKYTCLQCQKHFTESRSLARHLRDSCKFNKLPRGRYQCDWCGLSFGRNDILHRHVQEVHLMQGSEKRMSKIRREISGVLYGESLDAGLEEKSCAGPHESSVSELVDRTKPSLSSETGRNANIELQYGGDDAKHPFDIADHFSLKTPDVYIADVDLPVDATSASDAVDDLTLRRDHGSNRTIESSCADDFDIEDWIDLCFLDEHTEINRG